jgi:putative MATE family efflux protein
MQEFKSDLTEGSNIKTVWTISWPMVSTYLLQTLVSLVDVKMVGSLGQENIAAVGLATSALMIILMLMMGFSTGTTALVARYSGEGSRTKVLQVIQQSYIISFLTALSIVATAGVFSTPIITFLGGKGEVIPIASGYLTILSLGALFLTGNLTISAILLGLGRTKANLQILGAINLLNVVGNYLLIFGIEPFPRLETYGAAWASVISRAIGLIWGFWLISSWGFKYERISQIWQIQKEFARKIMAIGFPAAVDAMSRRFQIAALNKILSYTAYGTKAISAFTVGLQAEAISFMPGLAFSAAATSLVGHSLGARKPERAEESSWTSVRFAAVLMSVVGILLVIFSRQIVRFFTPDETVVAIGSHYLIINAIAQPLIAVNMVLSGALRGAGDPRTPFWISASTLWGLRVPLAIVLGLVVGLQADGVWYAMLASIVASCILLITQFRKGNWKEIKL